MSGALTRMPKLGGLQDRVYREYISNQRELSMITTFFSMITATVTLRQSGSKEALKSAKQVADMYKRYESVLSRGGEGLDLLEDTAETAEEAMYREYESIKDLRPEIHWDSDTESMSIKGFHL